jgi:hypothetical protein
MQAIEEGKKAKKARKDAKKAARKAKREAEKQAGGGAKEGVSSDRSSSMCVEQQPRPDGSTRPEVRLRPVYSIYSLAATSSN